MKKLKNYVGSCKTKRGCNTDLDACPSDGVISIIYSGVHGTGYDSKEILPVSYIVVDKIKEEATYKTAA